MNFFASFSYFKIISFLIIFTILFHQSLNAQQPAFPTAYGAGAYATGGRGGKVIHVTNLNDKGAGSFREAITMKIPRTIVFDVSGVIVLKSLLYIDQTNSNVTIAGQTAPDGGITITGERFFLMRVDNLICRYIRFKGGIDADVKPNSGDGLGNDSVSGVASMTRQIFDHCTFGFGADEAASWYGTGNGDNITDITIQRSLFIESIKGSIIGKQSGKTGNPPTVSFISNLFYNSGYRFPNISGDRGRIDVINNVTWNSSARLIRANGSLQLNHIGNYNRFNYVPLHNNTLNLFAFGTVPKIYTANNKIVTTNTNRRLTGTVSKMNSDNKLSWRFFLNEGGYKTGDQLPNSYFTNTQYSLLGRSFSILTAEQAFIDVSNNVGCDKRLNADGSSSVSLDKLDLKSLNHVKTGTYSDKLPQSKYKVDLILQKTRENEFYKSNPHIPEIWFNAQVPKGQDHNDKSPNGYTWLEEYLNQVDGSNNPIAVKAIKIAPDEAKIELSKTLQLSKVVTPTNASFENGMWYSSNTKVATVDNNGLVTSVSTGEVEITFKSTDGGEEGTAEIEVFKKSSQVSAGDDQQICRGETTTLTAIGGTIYLWSTGDKTPKITVKPSKTTTYTVTAYDPSGKNSNKAEVKVSVSPVPVVDAGSNITIQSGESTTLKAKGATTYNWNTGSTGSSITVSPKSTTTYIVTGKTNDCEATSSVTVTVGNSSKVTANAGGERNLCAGSSTNLTATGGSSYVWSTGEKTAIITVSPSKTTVYTVTAYDNSGKNSNSAEVKVNVKPVPVVDAGNNISIQSGQSTTLKAKGASSYKWSTGNSGSSISVSPKTTTTYFVTGKINSCEVTATVTVMVSNSSKIIASAGEDRNICAGSSATLTAAGGSSYLWSTGETTSKITVSPKNSAIYTVTAFDKTGNNNDKAQVKVNVKQVPVIDLGRDIIIQAGESATIAAKDGEEYIWNTGANDSNITVRPQSTTIYTATGDINGCEAKGEVKVIVVNASKIIANAGEDVEICSASPVILTATGGSSYRWSTGERTVSIKVSPRSTTVYTVRAYDESRKNSATDDVKVTVKDMSSLNIGSDFAITKGESTTLNATGASSYLWHTGATTPSILVSPHSTSRYTVTGIKNGCEAKSTIKVTVLNPKKSKHSETSSSGARSEKEPILDLGKSNPDSFLDNEAKVNVQNEYEQLEFLVYPNPTSGEININISNLRRLSSIHLYNILGKSIYTEKINMTDQGRFEKNISISGYPSGIYLLQLVDDQRVFTKKIILK